MFKLRDQVARLEAQLREAQGRAAEPGDLAQGEDLYAVDYWYETQKPKISKAGSTYWVKGEEGWGQAWLTWNAMFKLIAPVLINGKGEFAVLQRLNDVLRGHAEDLVGTSHSGQRLESVKISSESVDQIKMQFRALGLIDVTRDGQKADLTLTDAGDAYANVLFALRRGEEGM